MKRLGAIICMIAIVFALSAPYASATGLTIEKTSPEDGTKGVPLENFGVKVFFNEAVYNPDNDKVNEAACKIVDKKGNEVDTMVVFNPKDKNVALVLAKTEDSNGNPVVIEPTTEYTLIIDESFVAANGDSLGKTEKITFTTLNPSTSMKISMAMMAVMMVGMIIASSKAMKKKDEEENKEKHKDEKFNPYKVAKETGKSVEEVLAEEKKRREKEEAKLERKARRNKEEIIEDEEDEDVLLPGHYRVKTVRTVAQGGSSYVTGRKAEAERKAAIEEKIRASKAAGKNKGKRKKK